MNRELKIMCVQPDDFYFLWQVHLWIENLRNLGLSDKAVILVFTPADRKTTNPQWKALEESYPEAEFHYYKDEHGIYPYMQMYIPILRPYTLWRHFRAFPELSTKAIFYCDCDVLLTDKLDIDALIDDDVNYLSDTVSYIGAKYFDSKINDVLPDKLEAYKQRDVLGELASVIGISREICEENELNSGGAQYLLKNITASFWSKVMNDCIVIRTYLQRVNRDFFESESKGFQSWCADMWAVLWNLWYSNREVKVVPEMNFAWAPEPIEKLQTCGIFHNAGVNSYQMEYGVDEQGNKLFYPAFYKAAYANGNSPFQDAHLKLVLENEESKKRCTWFYTDKLKTLSSWYNQ